MATDDTARTDELLRVLNSTPAVDGRVQDLLGDQSRAADGDTLRHVREVRGLLQEIVRGHQPAATLQPVLDDVRRRPLAREDGIAWETLVDDEWAGAVELVLTWDEITRTTPGRLRPCANPDCTLFLLDRSRAGVGRWCSMAACGNRAKARRHYERHRLDAGA